MSTSESLFFFSFFKLLRHSIFRSFITERKSSPEMFIQCNLMKTVPGIRLRTFKNNVCPGIDEVFQLQCWLVPFEGLSNPAIHGSSHRLLFCEVSLPDPLCLSCVDYHYFFLCSLLCLGWWLWGSPEAFGQQLWWWPWRCWAPQGLRAETRRISAGQLLPGATTLGSRLWGTLGLGYDLRILCLSWHISSLWEWRLGYVIFSFPPSKDKIRTISLLQVWAWV